MHSVCVRLQSALQTYTYQSTERARSRFGWPERELHLQHDIKISLYCKQLKPHSWTMLESKSGSSN
jgi:hypothetical protein